MTSSHDELGYLSLGDAARLIRIGDLSPVELTEALLARIEQLEPHLNAFVTIASDVALASAREARDALGRRSAIDELGPLHGVPLAIKDLIDVQGMPTTAGSASRRKMIAGEDAHIVGHLRAAGASFLGKTQTHEWAFGTTTVNPHFGPTHNPWKLDRIPGGSSGGNGAGLAAGLFAGCVGSDTGGSVRIPAAHCGVVGLKPTRGRLSLKGIVPLSWTLDHAGPMARSVKEVALLLEIIEGYDPRDPVSARTPAEGRVGHLLPTVDGLRIGIPSDYFWDHVDPDLETVVRSALRTLEELGATIFDLPALNWREAFRANGYMLLADAAAFHRERIEHSPEELGADILERLQRGIDVTGPEYAAARRQQTEWQRRLAQLFERVDLLATPVTPEPARTIEDAEGVETARVLTSLTAPFNMTGVPAISVPCGFTEQGLPVGLQLVAPWWAEGRLLRAALAYEEATDWHLRRPKLPPVGSAEGSND